MTFVIHAKVPGRARFKITGLFRSEPLKKFLEFRLSRQKTVIKVSANTVTSNLLVIFNNNTDLDEVIDLIEQTMEDFGTILEEQDNSESALPKISSTEKKQSVPDLQPILFQTGSIQNQNARPWHIMKSYQVIEALETQKETGLTTEVVRKRQKIHGPNALPESKSRSRWEILKYQFVSLPVALLGVAAGVSILTGGLLDAVVIMGVVMANGLIGYATESEAAKTIDSLKDVVHPIAEVLRNGRVEVIPADQVVPGDIVLLKPGAYVVADCRVLEASHLSIDESVLTGESMPVLKMAKTLRLKEAPLADRKNMIYMGTLVTGGEGLAVVTAMGASTEMGRLKILLDETTAPQTPIEKQLNRAGDQLVLLCGAICSCVFIIGFLRGYGFLQMMKMAISLAAAAVPEGLPAAATINFSLGIKRMRKHNVLIRNLQAVETLGSVQTVCLDKTGTLTQNKMFVTEVYGSDRRLKVKNGICLLDNHKVDPLDFKELQELINVCILCNETKVNGADQNGDYILYGSPTENALVLFAISSGVDVKDLRSRYPLLNLSYRSESRFFMSSLHNLPNGGGKYLAVKGSPLEVLHMCTWYLKDGEKIELTEKARLEIEKENGRMASDALRVLGVACAQGNCEPEPNTENNLIWLGLIGMADPIREGARELIDVYHRAQIDTVMITGDQSASAYAVGRRLDISKGDPPVILDSAELLAVDLEVMEALAKKVHIYSRVTPAHKLKIVQSLQAAGKVVAMTGDGINDGPALKAADIGIAMGEAGTDVAREVADVILEKDDLETLIIAVRDGRTTYNNIRKSVHFFLSTNLTEIMVMFTAMTMGIGFPLNIMQLLWINIISDIFPGLALSVEEPDSDIMEQPPRDPNAPMFSAEDFKRMVFESSIISAGAMSAYGYGISRYGMGSRATSLAFQGLTIGQLLHAISCRSEKKSIFHGEKHPPNRCLDIALGGSLIVQALTMIIPGLRNFLGTSPLSIFDMAIVGGSAVLPLIVNELTKQGSGDKSCEKTSSLRPSA